MYRVITKHTRPNTGVEFFNPKTSTQVSDETRAYIRQNYIVTGKIVHSEETVSNDGLSLNLTAIYQSEATYNEWKNDQFIIDNLFNVGAQHKESTGITSVIESAEEI